MCRMTAKDSYVQNGSEKIIKTSNVTATHVPDIQSSHAVNSLNNDATYLLNLIWVKAELHKTLCHVGSQKGDRLEFLKELSTGLLVCQIGQWLAIVPFWGCLCLLLLLLGLHIFSFDWFLSGLEWILNLEFYLLKCLIFYRKLLRNIRSRLNSSTFWVFRPIFRYVWSKCFNFDQS